MIRNKACNFFLDHVWNENLAGKLKRVDKIVFWPNFHSKCDQEKNYKLHFLIHNIHSANFLLEYIRKFIKCCNCIYKNLAYVRYLLGRVFLPS
jgi:hypothetical protein